MEYLFTAQLIKQPEHTLCSLWISGQRFASNLKQLDKHKISAVLSIGSDPFTYPTHIAHLYLEVEDAQTEDISQVFDKAYDFIEKERQKSNVLVHCMAGMSRSATILAYYLMRKHRWSADRSIRQIAKSRPIVRPNRGFVKQLIQQEQKLGFEIRSKF